MTKQEAYAKVAELTDQAMKLVKDCEKIADEYDVTFGFDVAYGMGGTYYPKPNETKRNALAKLSEAEREALEISEDDDDYGWKASSHSC